MREESEDKLVKGCLRMDHASQKAIYKKYYSSCLNICMRYANSKEDAVEILNDGFLKVFTKIYTKKKEVPLKSWIMRIMVNTSIDFYRANLKEKFMEDIENIHVPSPEESALDNMGYHEIIQLVQKLSLAYRTVFNLFVIEGFSHEEISKKLSISVGTSKSNLHKARENLKAMIQMVNNL
jgi:RNA polymerase sigma-70 factor (ECF subfamily)